MSTEIAEVKGRYNKLDLSQFYGGKKEGLCLQLTPWPPDPTGAYVQFTKTQVQQLVRELQNWLGETELPWEPADGQDYRDQE
jgi:hypothetical protein